MRAVTKNKNPQTPTSSKKNVAALVKRIKYLHRRRKKGKGKGLKRFALTPKQRLIILKKTDSKCHICGISLLVNDFQADHVSSHTSGGKHIEDNYLPSCRLCNNYRWHYIPKEIQLILKLGIWAKSNIENETGVGLQIADNFSKCEIKRKNRSKKKQ